MKKDRVIHCRLTEAEHDMIRSKAEASGLSITQLVVRAALAYHAEPPEAAN